MDSKLLYKSLIVVLLVITLMVGVVLLVNYGNGTLSQSQETQGHAKTESNVTKTEYGTLIGTDTDAFLEDSTFFDSETKKTSDLETNENILSLICTSIQRDLRIQIVDSSGKPVENESFYITLKDVGEYKDLDQDGVIYIGDLSPGEYEVSLNKMDGYQVADSALKVNVKSQVSYSEISDISLLIKTEEDIDVMSEDTAYKDALEDADDTEMTEAKALDDKVRLGIDVSKWNREIDWKKVKQSGVDYAIIRCGYRGSKTGSLVEDPMFLTNIEGAKEAGISVGVYFFTQATTEVEAVEEASTVLCLCEQYDLDYPVFVDTESAGGNGRADSLDVDTRTKVVKAFCQTIQNAGKKSGVYASRNWFYDRLDESQIQQYCIWLAEYRSTPLYNGNYQLWQFTSNGAIDGIEGRVDLDYSYLGY